MRVNRWKKSIALLLAMVMVCAMALAGCSGKNGETDGTDANAEPYSKDIFAMDTYMTVSAYGEQGEKAVDSAVKEINRLDALLSTGKDTSEVSALNKNEGGDLSADTNALMDAALDLYESTDHVFDITIYPVMKLWGFTDQNYKVPSDGDLKAALELVDASTLDYNQSKKTVDFTVKGTKIDFGGIAKGYTSATVAQLYRDLGVTSGLINLGGNVQTVQSQLKLHPYAAKQTARQCARLSAGWLTRLYDQGVETDFAVKSGRLRDQDALNRMLFSIGLTPRDKR